MVARYRSNKALSNEDRVESHLSKP